MSSRGSGRGISPMWKARRARIIASWRTPRRPASRARGAGPARQPARVVVASGVGEGGAHATHLTAVTRKLVLSRLARRADEASRGTPGPITLPCCPAWSHPGHRGVREKAGDRSDHPRRRRLPGHTVLPPRTRADVLHALRAVRNAAVHMRVGGSAGPSRRSGLRPVGGHGPRPQRPLQAVRSHVNSLGES